MLLSSAYITFVKKVIKVLILRGTADIYIYIYIYTHTHTYINIWFQ